MKIIFAGTPEIAVPTLEALLNSEHEVVAVYTQPDKVSGRGRQLSVSPVKACALGYNVPIIQPVSLKTSDEQAYFRSWQADLMIVLAYGLILPEPVLTAPIFGCINIHVSLLPRWRGASPIQQAILAGDKETGVSIMQMDIGLDTGPILDQKRCHISPTDTAGTLHDRLAQLGVESLWNVLPQIANSTVIAKKQPNEGICYANKITKKEGLIDWNTSAIDIERKVRAFNPWPVAYFFIDGEYVRLWGGKVLKTDEVLVSAAVPGTILAVDSEGIDVAAGNNTQFRITQLQMANAKILSVKAYLNAGHSLFLPGKILASESHCE